MIKVYVEIHNGLVDYVAATSRDVIVIVRDFDTDGIDVEDLHQDADSDEFWAETQVVPVFIHEDDDNDD